MFHSSSKGKYAKVWLFELPRDHKTNSWLIVTLNRDVSCISNVAKRGVFHQLCKIALLLVGNELTSTLVIFQISRGDGKVEAGAEAARAQN